MEVITTKEMLRLMDAKDKTGAPLPFSFSYVTWNANSKTGGALRHYDYAELASSSKEQKVIVSTGVRKNNHQENMTRNIFIGGEEHPRTFNIRTIIRFNGKKVVY